MIQNYLKIALRNLLRQRFFTLINILGLTLGMTCCFLIMLFVRHELSYDQFNEKLDRIYRVTYDPKFAGLAKSLAVLPPLVSPLIKHDFPEVEQTARLFRQNASVEIRQNAGVRKFHETRFAFADSTLLSILSFQFLEGNPQKALTKPFGIVLSQKTARTYFGDTPALGKILLVDGKHTYVVTGVVADLPDNSHLHLDLLANYETMFASMSPVGRENLAQNWVISHSITYVLLKPFQDPERINRRFASFLNSHAPKEFARDIVYRLQPLKDVHLHSDLLDEPEPVGHITHVYIFIGIAVITLLIAGINFVNLATARSLRRAKEVGMRKVLGAEQKQLIGQFLGESLLLSLLAFVLSILCVEASLPLFNDLTQKHFTTLSIVQDWPLLVGCVGIFFLVGILAGLYPAFFIADFKPMETLKGNFSSGKARGGVLRQALLVFQFSASVALMIGTLVAYRQLQYIQQQDLGFQQDFVLTAAFKSENLNTIFDAPNDSLYTRLRTFREAIMRSPQVVDVTLSNQRPGEGVTRRGVVPEGFTENDKLFAMSLTVDYQFIPTYGMQLIAGRNFSEAYGTDRQQGFIINETGVKRYHWKSPVEAIGKRINLEGKEGKVIGVVKDFHAESLFQPIDVLVMDLNPRLFNTFSFKIRPERTAETVAFLERLWNQYFPEKVFDYQFLDEGLLEQYEREQRLGKIIGYFAGLAVFISCLGLFGLIALVSQQRTKEIGVRKVLGASVSQIVLLLSRDFLRLVGLAIIIASPVAWYFMNQWLQSFAYRISIAWWMYAVAGSIAVLIAFITVGFHSIKAALVNPAKSLKTE